MPTYTIKVNGTTYEVAIDDPFASPIVATVNGQPYVAEMVAGVTQVVPAATPVVPLADPVRPAPQAAAAPPLAAPEGATISAQMPGKILAVAVKVGDRVEAGTEVLTLEAMKMAMAVKATAGGVVREVRVSAGQAVKYGEVLLVVG
jgi:biotin carboxyl carrier protein